MANLGDISKINLPNGNVVNIKDTTARTQANWNTNNGVKNAAPVNTASKTNSGYFFVNKLGWVIKANEEYWIEFDFEKTAGDCTVQLTNSNGNVLSSTYVACGSASSGHAKRKVIPTVDAYGYNAYFNETGTITISNLMIYPAFITDDTFEPYSLPNTKITPELIDLVDSGAKNLYNPSNTSTSASGLTGTITRNSDGSYTISGTTSGTVYYNMGSWITPEDGYYILSGGSAAESASQLIYDDHDWQTYESGNKKKLAYWTKGSIHNLYIRLDTGITISNVTFYPMICTKAAWDVSQKYVPYVMSNAELTIFTKGVYTSTRFSTNTTGVYVYTGVSFTIPANQIFEFIITDQYTGANTNFGTGILVADANDDININSSIIAENNIVNSQTGKSYWVRQVSGMTPHGRSSNKTYYVWVNRGSNVESPICMYLRRIV